MPTRPLLLSCILIFSTLAFAACGGGGDETGTVEEVIETSATTTDPADCKKLETQQFIEQISQESGAAAVKECEEEAENQEGSKSVSVTNVAVKGSSATAEAALKGGSLDGQTVEVELVKDGDQWKMDEVVKFTKFNQAKLAGVFERELSKGSSELSPRLANCFVEAFKSGSQAEVEELLLSGSAKALEEVAEAC
ncbi:MAG TPA: hypothetical protein VGC63_07035 [Solirubrobacterales bacterium]